MQALRRNLLGAGLAALMVSSAMAAEPETAWEKAGEPLQATGAFVVPPPSGMALGAPDLDRAYARYEDHSAGGILSEVRLGVLGFWQDNSESEEGVYVSGQVLFDPFVRPFDNWFLNVFLRPRPHIGGSASPDGTDQLFAGVTWTVPLWWNFFLDASFGGTVHNGPLSGAEVSLGCSILFRESIGLGLNIGDHWSVIAAADHSSHADLCDGENDGLTHVGVHFGYRF